MKAKIKCRTTRSRGYKNKACLRRLYVLVRLSFWCVGCANGTGGERGLRSWASDF